MNTNTPELLDQFIAESRECLEAIAAKLLEVERAPTDAALLNDLFRSVHTLKGNCGLFEFQPLERVVHAGEDLLDRVRNRTLDYSPELADALLDAMDFSSGLIDQIERQGWISEASQGASQAHAAALRAWLGGAPAARPATAAASCGPDGDQPAPPWACELARVHAGARVALRYRPEPDCFFKGEDPWRLATTLPGLVHLEAAPQVDWPQGQALDEWDCFRCNLALSGLSTASADEVREHFRCVAEQVEIVVLDGSPEAGAGTHPLLAQRCAQLWADQVRLLAHPQVLPGTVIACARSLSALLGARGDDEASRLERSLGLARVSQAGDAGALRDWARQNAPQGMVQAAPAHAPAGSPGPAPESARSDEPTGERKVLRVAQEKIDHLMGLIGEMVVAKNSLPYLAHRAENQYGQRELAREIKAQYGVINRIAEDMHHAVMQVRMLPVGTVFQRFGRLVRDISRKLGKEVRLVIEGEDTEADKNVIEPLADPLIHVLRNSLDHGLETPELRRAAGKPACGTLRIAARQEGDRVLIEISDDGAGIDVRRVRDKAVERGLVSAERAAAMDDDEAVRMVFLPGFSTAEQVSDLSGRGVGMDVVRSAVERIHGSVDLRTVPGQGTTITLSLPLSMAVTHVMVVESGGLRLGVPMDLIVETVRVHAQDIHRFKTAQTAVLRGRIVPLRPLNELLDIDAPALCNSEGEHAVLVLRLASGHVGLVVDQFHGASDILLKPLEGVLAGLPGIAGSALMGDGSVLMVINPKELL